MSAVTRPQRRNGAAPPMEVLPPGYMPPKKPRAPTGALCVRACTEERPHYRVLGLWVPDPYRDTVHPSTRATQHGEVRTVVWIATYPNGLALVAPIRDGLLLLPELVSMDPGAARILTEAHVLALPPGTRGYWWPAPVRAPSAALRASSNRVRTPAKVRGFRWR